MLTYAPPKWPLHLSAPYSQIAVINEELPKEEAFRMLPKRGIWFLYDFPLTLILIDC